MGYNGWINGQVDSDYEKARFSATLNNIVNLLRDEPRTLLPFEEVRSRINIRGQVDRGLQLVPLKAIIGSEGRYSDFDRSGPNSPAPYCCNIDSFVDKSVAIHQ